MKLRRLREPLVSVVMPVYRADTQHLGKSIESILKQKYQNLEILVLVDKSPDTNEDREISIELERYEKDSRLRVIRNSVRNGFVGSLNQGLALAQGEFIARMDSDDISSPSRIRTQVEFLIRSRYQFVGSWANVIDTANRSLGYLRPPVTASDIRRRLILHNPFIHGTMIFRSSFLKEAGPYDPTLLGAEDYDLYLRGFSMGYEGVNIPEPLLDLRENDRSITRGEEWWKTRISYSRAKFHAVTRYGYTSPVDIGVCLLSTASILIPPSHARKVKEFIGWYSSSQRDQLSPEDS